MISSSFTIELSFTRGPASSWTLGSADRLLGILEIVLSVFVLLRLIFGSYVVSFLTALLFLGVVEASVDALALFAADFRFFGLGLELALQIPLDPETAKFYMT